MTSTKTSHRQPLVQNPMLVARYELWKDEAMRLAERLKEARAEAEAMRYELEDKARMLSAIKEEATEDAAELEWFRARSAEQGSDSDRSVGVVSEIPYVEYMAAVRDLRVETKRAQAAVCDPEPGYLVQPGLGVVIAAVMFNRLHPEESAARGRANLARYTKKYSDRQIEMLRRETHNQNLGAAEDHR